VFTARYELNLLNRTQLFFVLKAWTVPMLECLSKGILHFQIDISKQSRSAQFISACQHPPVTQAPINHLVWSQTPPLCTNTLSGLRYSNRHDTNVCTEVQARVAVILVGLYCLPYKGFSDVLNFTDANRVHHLQQNYKSLPTTAA
jgi:hypothetical protein